MLLERHEPTAAVDTDTDVKPVAGVYGRLPTTSGLLRFALLALGLLAAYPWFTHQLAAFSHDSGGIYDFSVYYAAALALRDNAHANIYDPAVLRHAATVHGAYLMPVATLYLYPPLLAMLFVPLTFVSFHTAALIWVACNIAFWLLATGLLVAMFADLLGCGAEVQEFVNRFRQRPSARNSGASRGAPLSDSAVFAIALPLTLSFMSAPFEESVVIGQVSLFVLFLLVLALWLDRRGQPAAAGAVLALASLVKVFPGLFVLYYLLRGRWRVVAGYAAAIVGLIIAMALYVGVDGVLATRLIFTNGASSGQQYQNEALARLPFWLGVMLGHAPSDRWANLLGYGLIALVLMAFVGGLAWHRLVRARLASDESDPSTALRRRLADYCGYGWALCTMVLISPVTWEHHFAWLFPAFLIVSAVGLTQLSGADRQTRMGVMSTAMFLLVVTAGYVLVAHDLPFGYDGRVPFDPSPHLLGKIPARPFFMIQRPLGAFVLWCAAGYLFLRLGGWRRGGLRQAFPAVRGAVEAERIAAGVEAAG